MTGSRLTSEESGPAVSAHTRGPWQFYADLPSTDPNWHIVTNASRMRVVANVHIEPGNAMDLANAHLIASAPDMLAMLKQLASECSTCEGTEMVMGRGPDGEPDGDRCPDCYDIQTVIAKAEGRV